MCLVCGLYYLYLVGIGYFEYLAFALLCCFYVFDCFML